MRNQLHLIRSSQENEEFGRKVGKLDTPAEAEDSTYVVWMVWMQLFLKQLVKRGVLHSQHKRQERIENVVLQVVFEVACNIREIRRKKKVTWMQKTVLAAVDEEDRSHWIVNEKLDLK